MTKKIQIIGKCNPAIIVTATGTYACTGDAWHSVPAGTILEDIQFVPEFTSWSTRWQPRYIEEYLLHKEMLQKNSSYAYKWQLFCKQQYKQAFGIDLMSAAEAVEHWVSLKQLHNIRHSQDINNLIGLPTVPVKYKVFGSRGNSHVLVLYPESMQAYCDCPGFTYRHSCKHVNYLLNVVINDKKLEKECRL